MSKFGTNTRGGEILTQLVAHIFQELVTLKDDADELKQLLKLLDVFVSNKNSKDS